MTAPSMTARFALRGPDALSDVELLALACAWPVGRSQLALDGAPRDRERLDALLAFARRRSQPLDELPTLGNARAVAALLQPELGACEVEELHALALDSRNRLLRRSVVARGAVNQVMATAREVFRPLIVAGAARAIVVHNHPSGEPEPSVEDRQLTVRLVAAGELVGIPVVDHVIVARAGWFSFADERAQELRVPLRRRTQKE
jgi:DNA repair protein RadC